MPSLALERRARGDLMDAKLPIGLDLQQDEVGNFFATTDASFPATNPWTRGGRLEFLQQL